MSTHCYHTTAKGHNVHLTLEGSGGPVLITIHGGGIVRGSRRDVHVPQWIKGSWPGVIIAIDYRLFGPSNGADILEDMKALFAFLPTLPIDIHQLFLAGFSGGGYPLRLAAVVAAQESHKPNPKFTVLGCVSYFGMGGDFLLDYWLTPQRIDVNQNDLASQQAEWKPKAQKWYDEGIEYSDSPYGEDLEGWKEERGDLWHYWHMTGTINDAVTGQVGFSDKLRMLPYSERSDAVADKYRELYPQIYFDEHPEQVPPFLLIHGDADPVVPYEESFNTLRSLMPAGKVEMVTVDGGRHNLEVGEVLVPQQALDAHRYTVDWMMRRLPKP